MQAHCGVTPQYYFAAMKNNEIELIKKVIEGDRYSAIRLVENHRQIAFATAYHALGNADDAQDVAQEALVYALQSLSELRDRTKFSAWLKQITLTLCAGRSYWDALRAYIEQGLSWM